MGGGPVLRVGDRLSIFDDAATRAIAETARERGIEVQRLLLDGGSCEASAFQAYGIASAGLSILLGNYHNCGPEGAIESEYVSLRDAESLVDLIVALIEGPRAGSGGPVRKSFRSKLEKRVGTYAEYGRATRKWFRDRGERIG